MQSITVFCSASDAIAPDYKHEAEVLGRWIGTHGYRLVYGGANGGLMEIVARCAREETEAPYWASSPGTSSSWGRSSQQPTELITTNNMGDRKRHLIEQGDIIVALPGGIGTIDELFDRHHHPRCSAATTSPSSSATPGGLFDSLIQQFDLLRRQGFLRYDRPDLYQVVPDARACCELLAHENR